MKANPVPIVLRQYQSTEVAIDGRLARSISAEAGSAMRVTVGSQDGLWTLTPWHSIGTLVVDGQPILIRPKIPPENVFALLEVGLTDASWRKELFGYDQSSDLLSAVVSWFARLVETTLGRGLLRNYRQHEDRLVAMRGRVDISGVFRQPGLALPVPCRFDEFTADIAENRYLRAAIQRATRVASIPAEDQRRLRQELMRLEDVADAPVRPDDLDRITFNRLNQHYQPALRLARVLLENLSLIDREGETTAASFLVDMNALFEKFVAERLKKLLWDRLEVTAQDRAHLGERKKVLMKPDLVFLLDSRAVYVGDTKYKLTDDAEAKSADYYQLLAYCTALRLDEGVLIYCRNVGDDSEGEVVVRHAGQRLLTYALDLGGSPEDIDRELEKLANWIDGRVRSQSRDLISAVS